MSNKEEKKVDNLTNQEIDTDNVTGGKKRNISRFGTRSNDVNRKVDEELSMEKKPKGRSRFGTIEDNASRK